MKIVHTSDWHLGHRLYNYDRADEEERFFGQLGELLAAERPDALLVSGDVYHTGAPGNDVSRRFTDRMVELQSRSPETEVVIVAGNHDSASRLEIDRALWRRCRVHVFGAPAEHPDGTADFERNVVVLPGKGVVAAVPFCHGRNFPAVSGSAGENRQGEYFKAMESFVRERNFAGLPTVLMAHLAVGAETDFTGQDRIGAIGGEECVEASALGSEYDYVALGHIHCPQWVKGARRRVRYCGTPRAIHFDEVYPHGVDVVEVESGSEPTVRTVVLEPLRRLVTFGGSDGVAFDEALSAMNAAELAAETYVRLNVALGAGELPGADWTDKARAAASAKGLRFCLVNTVRRASAAKKVEAGGLTVDELREMSAGQVLDILSAVHELNDRQRELLSGLIEGMVSERQGAAT